MQRLFPVVLLATLAGPMAVAQETTTSEQAFKQVTTELADAIVLEDGTAGALTLSYFLSEEGEVAGLQVAASSGRSSGFCTPICFTRRGPPKRTFCTVADGCPGTTNGGGGSPVLTTGPLLIEITTDEATSNATDLGLDIQIQQFGLDQVRDFSTVVTAIK